MKTVPMNLNLNVSNLTSKFDWIVKHGAVSHAPWDRILAESPRFVALASLGSIVPGWVLIVPRTRALNLASLSSGALADLANIREQVAGVLQRRFSGRPFEFEHGPSAPNGLLGCGVEQAHLHMVPLDFDLVEAVCDSGPTGDIRTFSGVSPWSLADGKRDYWIARDRTHDRSVLCYPDTPISQGIRKIVAERVGTPDAWNYRTEPFLENVEKTHAAFASVCDA